MITVHIKSNNNINKYGGMLSAFIFSTADMLNNVAEQQILRLRPWFRFTTMRVLLLAGLAIRQYSRPCFLNLQYDRPVIIRTLLYPKANNELIHYSLVVRLIANCVRLHLWFLCNSVAYNTDIQFCIVMLYPLLFTTTTWINQAYSIFGFSFQSWYYLDKRLSDAIYVFIKFFS